MQLFSQEQLSMYLSVACISILLCSDCAPCSICRSPASARKEPFAMIGRRTILIASMAMLIGAMLVTSAGAHPVTVGDGSRLDWFGLGPSGKNIGVLSHNTATQGEFVWADVRGD